jgi:hypothetical protein
LDDCLGDSLCGLPQSLHDRVHIIALICICVIRLFIRKELLEGVFLKARELIVKAFFLCHLLNLLLNFLSQTPLQCFEFVWTTLILLLHSFNENLSPFKGPYFQMLECIRIQLTEGEQDFLFNTHESRC